jgi:hypothetical protein
LLYFYCTSFKGEIDEIGQGKKHVCDVAQKVFTTLLHATYDVIYEQSLSKVNNYYILSGLSFQPTFDIKFELEINCLKIPRVCAKQSK